MAEQKICDRPHKKIITTGEDYFPLVARNADGTEQHIDLCGECGNDFKAFMNQSPQQPTVAPVQPEQPAVDPNAPQQ